MSSLDELVKGVKGCDLEHYKWNRKVFGNLNNNIMKRKKELEGLMSVSELNVNAMDSCKRELNELLNME